jgi:hypothetical protein
MRFVLGVVFSLMVAACLSQAVFADDDDRSLPAAASLSQDAPVLLSVARQQRAGIETRPAVQARGSLKVIGYGTVLQLEPLLQLRQQYLAARLQQDNAKARSAVSQLNWARTQALHQQDIVSTRRLQEQQAQSQSDSATLEISRDQQQTVVVASQLYWGPLLTRWFVESADKNAETFLRQQRQLIEVLVPQRVNVDARQTLYVGVGPQSESAVPVGFIALAPQVDAVSQQRRYFYQTLSQQSTPLPIGAHVTVSVASPMEAANALIPESALIWHLDSAYAFVQIGDEQFSRRQLRDVQPAGKGFVSTADVALGDKVVISGAQTLLSQQLKKLSPNDDND